MLQQCWLRKLVPYTFVTYFAAYLQLFCCRLATPSRLGIVIAGIVRADTVNTRINGCCFMLAALLG